MANFAIPKSAIRKWQSELTSKLDGLRSRCAIPAVCKYWNEKMVNFLRLNYDSLN